MSDLLLGPVPLGLGYTLAVWHNCHANLCCNAATNNPPPSTYRLTKPALKRIIAPAAILRPYERDYPMTMQETETDTPKRKIAEHTLLGADGSKVETEEEARGYSYKLLANNETFEWKWDDAPEAERIMLAIFGAKTLATNEVSQVRNGKEFKDSDDPAQYDKGIEALRARFADIRDGKWMDRTSTAGTTRVNKDYLAEAICTVLVNAGKKTDDEVAAGYKATVRDRLESDNEWMTKVRKQPDVAAEYARIAGKTAKATMTVDDLLT